MSGATDGATAEPSEPAHAGKAAAHSVWYRWIAPADGRAEFDTFGYGDSWFDNWTAFDARLAVYRGSSLSGLTPVTANDDWDGSLDSRVSFPVHAGLEYYVAVDVATGAPGRLALSWNVGPVNDDCAKQAGKPQFLVVIEVGAPSAGIYAIVSCLARSDCSAM